MDTINILVANSDAVVRQCLRRAMELDPILSVKWEADNGLEALHLVRKHSPHVVLMDAQMPRMDGIEATKCLKSCSCKARVVVVSSLEQLKDAAVSAGADAVVMIDSGCDVIRQTIYQVLDKTKQL